MIVFQNWGLVVGKIQKKISNKEHSIINFQKAGNEINIFPD